MTNFNISRFPHLGTNSGFQCKILNIAFKTVISVLIYFKIYLHANKRVILTKERNETGQAG